MLKKVWSTIKRLVLRKKEKPANLLGALVLVSFYDYRKVVCSPSRLKEYSPKEWVPIGVVVVPDCHDMYCNGDMGVMSLVPMSCEYPTTGTFSEEHMRWGPMKTHLSLDWKDCMPVCQNKDVVIGHEHYAYLPSDAFIGGDECKHDKHSFYIYGETVAEVPSPFKTNGDLNPMYRCIDYPSSEKNCLTDFAGKFNTSIMLTSRGKKDYTIWKPAWGSYQDYPAASVCDMFRPIGTTQGDWYLPSVGELGYLCARRNLINSSIIACKDVFGIGVVVAGYWYWASNEQDCDHARVVKMNSGMVDYVEKDGNNAVRAYMRINPEDVEICI